MYEHKPYEDYFYERLLRNLLVASCGHFRLSQNYRYADYQDINNRIGTLYFYGQGADKDIGKGWDYISMIYSNLLPSNATFRFLISDSLGSNQKNDILNTIEEDDTTISQLNENQLYTLGIYFFGILKEQNSYTTLDYYDQDHSSEHVIIERNYTKAFNCLKKAADKDYLPAIHHLGIMYHCGYGVEQNIAQGEQYFNNAVDIDPSYMKSIAILYHTHDEMQDFVKALQWYRRLEKRLDEDLADSDRKKINELVQLGLGLLYEYGKGVEQDYQKAIGYYQSLVDNKTMVGFHRLGLMYYYEKGVLFDYKKALNLFEKAALAFAMYEVKLPFVYPQTDSHDDGAQNTLVFCAVNSWELRGEPYYYLGIMHRNGQGIPQDEEKAQGYFREALKKQCRRAKYEIRD